MAYIGANSRNDGNCGVSVNTWNTKKRIDFIFVFFSIALILGSTLVNVFSRKLQCSRMILMQVFCQLAIK